MDLEQSVKNLQAQNSQFQVLILNFAKGQDELKNLVNPEEKGSAYAAKFIPWHMPLSQVLQQFLNQNLMTLLPPYSSPANPALGYKYNARCAYQSNSPGHDTEHCGPLKDKIQDLINDKITNFNSPEGPHMTDVAHNQKGLNERNQFVRAVLISTPAPQQRRKPDAPKRQFTKIKMTLAHALQHLLKIELITLRDPPKNPNTSTPGYKLNTKCAYHSNSPGHYTNNCWTLKNKIQDLINDGETKFNPLETLW
ncbi:uncharacterized protein LOC131611966 [Vicia villosa]|uniref:uncharacterized protein LOC131611966 n=1 Tax=Vicia villosa TaxID=3911 RepID=UPI00273B16A6|nr:uncharacterized protein LOC131611966 [Vicia villosa]